MLNIFYYIGNLKFEGTYLNGLRHGLGREYRFGNVVFEGMYFNGNRIGW